MSSKNDISSSIPSELLRSELLERSGIEVTKYAATGFTISALMSLVLFRKMNTRLLFTGLGTGFATGYAARTAQISFDNELLKYQMRDKN